MLHNVRWTARKIGQRIELIEPLVYRQRVDLPAFRMTVLPDPTPDAIESPPIGADVDDSGWETLAFNSYWGPMRTNFVLRTQFQVPADWPRSSAVGLYLPLGEPHSFSHPEALAFIDGTAFAACDRHHQEIVLRDNWRDGQPHLLALHGWTGNSNPEGEHGRLLLRQCQVVLIDQPTRDFIAAARVALGVAKMLDEHEPAKDRLLTALNDAFNLLDVREPFGDDFYASVAPASEALRQGIEQAGPALDVWITATGHAHIDVAWLWTLGQTRRKSGRTFHTVLRLMEQFPDYHFTQSQPQLYDYVREDYPALFEDIKARVDEGRWELIGGMWVEADCNLSGAESLARQFLLGRSFFRKYFGKDVESPVLWLPDVFGYAWALPQLIKHAGLDYFFTIKIGWSQYNRLPYDTFWWQGVDGTRVLTHFSTTKDPASPFASTYNAAADPTETIGTWMNFQQKELKQDLLMAFGYGDGGGGPTREMLENLREMSDFPATPRVHQRHVGEFFREVEAQVGAELPVWNGELYLEIHRGTYTTQSRNKRANRKSEFLLHDAEFLATLAMLLDADYKYPAADLQKAWELVCLNQFHDIIPGSSITDVYRDSLMQYGQITQLASAVRDEALALITRSVEADVLVINPTSFPRHDLALWPGQVHPRKRMHYPDGQTVLTQSTAEGTLISTGELAPYSVNRFSISDGDTTIPETGLIATNNLLENSYLHIEINDAGDIVRIYDKVDEREVLPPGAIANQFQAFEDRPMYWDAWDIDIFYDDKMWLSDPADSIQVVEQGPLRATLEIKRRILNSSYTQRISLCYNSRQLDFDTTIDWRERHVLLKVAFPVDVLTPQATYEIQWGHVQRPTHRNTSWDWARFETCAQKWVDLSEGNYGVSLLNDCKYGHDIHENTMRISLLRAPTMPDPEADQGEQHFAYSLLPHSDGWNEVTIAQAYALNDPLIVTGGDKFTQPGGKSGQLESLLWVDQPSIVIETVKRAEDGDGIIVRLYESQRRRGPVTIHAGFPLAAAWRTNLLEENESQIDVQEQSLRLHVRPFEIMTLRLLPA